MFYTLKNYYGFRKRRVRFTRIRPAAHGKSATFRTQSSTDRRENVREEHDDRGSEHDQSVIAQVINL